MCRASDAALQAMVAAGLAGEPMTRNALQLLLTVAALAMAAVCRTGV
jgi:hypothetical protein